MSSASNKLPDCLAHTGSEKAIEYAQNLRYAQAEVRTHKKDSRRSPPQSLQMMLARLTPRGWEISDRVKEFTAENLYEQIDGRAEFFLAYDMIRMTFAGFANSTDKGEFIDLSIYDMGTPTNAFGVFSGERSQGAPSLSLGRAGYRLDSNYYVWKGQYYIRIISSQRTDKLRRIGKDLAQEVSDFLNDSGEEVWGLSVLPKRDRVEDSVQYFKADAMGLVFMKNTYIAQYRKGGVLVTAFLSQRGSEESARNAVAQYAEYAKKYGKGIKLLKEKGVELLSCDMVGNYDVVFQKGRLMGGASSAKDQSLAVRMAVELWNEMAVE
jgi:hypothetical protein